MAQRPSACEDGGLVGDRPRPPVNEIVLSVAMVPQPAISGPYLPDVLGAWLQSHPRVETAPRYEMPLESSALGGLNPGPGFQVVMAAPTEPRYWLMSEDEQELIQVQSNYIALNWRRRDLTQEYPGYEVLRRKFAELLEATDEGLKRHNSELRPTRAEITYIDIIEPNAIWSSHNEVHRLFNITLPSQLAYERISVAFSQAMNFEPDRFAGRMHVNLQPNVNWLKQEPQISLNLTARSADLDEQSIDAALQFIDFSHEQANKVFLELLTDRAGKFWGLK
jgi:uncharacterized protein (TIGR04255 family)